MTVHNALVGVGLRDRVKIGASGKVATGIDIVKRLVQGADYTNAARAMMMAVGCIQAQTLPHQHLPGRRRHPGPQARRGRSTSPDKTERVCRYQEATVEQAVQVMASMGARPARPSCAPHMLRRRVDHDARRSATPSCSTTSRPASCSHERPGWPGGPTGSSPTPTRSEPEETP